MNCLYCCQFWIVIFVPGGSAACSPAASCDSADDHSGHRTKLRLKRNLRAEFRPITLPHYRVNRNYTVSSLYHCYCNVGVTSALPGGVPPDGAPALRDI